MIHFNGRPGRISFESSDDYGGKEPIRSVCEVAYDLLAYTALPKRALYCAAQSPVRIDVLCYSHLLGDFTHLHANDVVGPISHLGANGGVHAHTELLKTQAVRCVG